MKAVAPTLAALPGLRSYSCRPHLYPRHTVLGPTNTGILLCPDNVGDLLSCTETFL